MSWSVAFLSEKEVFESSSLDSVAFEKETQIYLLKCLARNKITEGTKQLVVKSTSPK